MKGVVSKPFRRGGTAVTAPFRNLGYNSVLRWFKDSLE